MFGTYIESAKIVEKLIETYQSLPMEEEERSTAINALMAARAMILKEEETAINRMEHESCRGDTDDTYQYTYEQLAGGM